MGSFRASAILASILLAVGCKTESVPATRAQAHRTRDTIPMVPLYESEHYLAASTASPRLTRETLERLEIQRRAYLAAFGIPDTEGPLLHLRLHRSREEMKRLERMPPWAEGMYDDSVCIQYVDGSEPNPYHWTLHEAVHQLNHEVAHLALPGWANEGIACLFSTSRMEKDSLLLGQLDPSTYPTWHIKDLTLSGDPATDVRAGRIVLPLDFVGGTDTSDLNRSVNAHYVSWATFVLFLHRKDPTALFDWARNKPTRTGLESRFGPLDSLQTKWYRLLAQLSSDARN